MPPAISKGQRNVSLREGSKFAASDPPVTLGGEECFCDLMARSSRQPSSSDTTHAPSAWTLIEGDCVHGLEALTDGSVDVVITDPPYEAEAHTPDRMVARTGGRLER